MAEIPNVIASEEIQVEWGNLIRDRTVQRYADVAERSSEIAAPNPGDLSYLEDSGDVDIYHSGSWRHIGTPAGVVMPYAGNSPPIGWLVCNGAAVSRTTYARLYAAIGDAFGDGDGSTTFNLPDLRGRFPMGVAASGTGDERGDTGGALTHTHTGPSHTHTGPSHTHTNPNTNSGGSHVHEQDAGSQGATKGTTFPSTHTFQGTGDDPQMHVHELRDTESGGSHSHSQSATGSGGTGNTGAGGTGSTGSGGTPPFVAMPYIIKT